MVARMWDSSPTMMDAVLRHWNDKSSIELSLPDYLALKFISNKYAALETTS